ncbi:hypothetical protein QL285_038513 [Trifolium repens]|nr:hypothetical protein QL285_038513 [Trifolium repens]
MIGISQPFLYFSNGTADFLPQRSCSVLLGSEDVSSSKSDKCPQPQESMSNFSLSHICVFRSIIERAISQSSCNLPFYHRLARTLSNRSKFNIHAFLEVFFRVITWVRSR